MLSKRVRRLLAAALMVPGMLSIQGCTDEEVLLTLGGIAIVGGAIAIGSAASNSNSNHKHHGKHNKHRPKKHWRAITADTEADEMNAISLMAQRYDIPIQSASTLKDTLTGALESQDLQPLYQLGLSRSDLMDIGRLEMISNSGINNLSQKLQISQEKAAGVVRQMIRDVRLSQAAAIN